MTTTRRRPMRSLAFALLGVTLAACGGFLAGPTPPPAPTPKPAPPDAEPWPELAWRSEDLPAPAEAFSRRLAAVTSGPNGIVAVGSDDFGGTTDGLIVRAPDGGEVEIVETEVTRGIGLEDVAADRAGYVAVGTIGTEDADGPHSRVGILVSADGVTWQALAPEPQFDVAYAGGIAAGPGAFLAWGMDADDDPVERLWRSVDGRTWRPTSAAEIGLPGVSGLAIDGTAEGWLATGEADGRPVVASSVDGLHWQVEVLPPSGRRDVRLTRVERVVFGSHGRLAFGGEGQACGFLWIEGDCPGWQIGWWSDGLGGWASLSAEGAPAARWRHVVAAGDRGFLDVSGSRVSASLDGLVWTDLRSPGHDAAANEAIVVDDRIVAVGERSLPNGRQVGWIAVGGPADVVEAP